MSPELKTIVYDFEVTAFDWIVVFRDIESEDHTVFHNDYDEIHAFINKVKKDLLVGFNNKHYDDYILKAIYHRATPEKVKELNDFIIVKGRQGWEFPFLKYKKKVFQTADLRDDIADKGLSLKAIEGNLNLPIVESSVPFDIDRPLTEDEVKEMIFYCKKDVDATVMLCKERSEYLQSKKLVGSMFGIDEREAVGLTNAKLSAKVLGATKTDYWDERDYHIPAVIRKDRIPHEILSFFLEIHNDTIKDDDLFATSLNVVIRTQAGDCPCSYAWGGVHGAKPCYIAEATDEDLIVNYDVASLYPNSMINFGYTSRSMSDPDAYKNIVKTRIGYKHAGDKEKANALKLIINTTYGAMLNEYNDLNDPKSGRSVCITNQLAMTDLIVGLAESVKSFDMINFNTDGVMFHLKKSEEVKAQAIIDEWCDRVGFELERDDIQKIIQKDVNNYICIKKDGKVKSKGGYVNIVDGGSFKMNTLRVVQKAIVDYFVKGSDPETTVKEDEDIFDFQMIAKTGSTYTGCVHEIAGELVEVNKVNRVYASHDETLGTLYKIKRKDGKIIKKDKVASLPEHCLTDNENEHTRSEIDDQFYIDLAKSRIKDFKVPKRKVLKDIEKMEVIEIMPRKATTKAEETTTAKAPEEVKIDLKEMNVYHRLNKARIDFLNTPISKSGDNKFAKFKYFELDDIIPVALPILDKYGLCYHITFLSDHATALLINTDDPEDLIEFKTPITELDVRAKGMNSNQALGAQETYARRRLWISMLELVENDTLDAISGNPNNVEVEKTEDAKDESEDTEDDETPDFMNIPDDVEGDTVEMLTSKTTTAIKKALKEYRDNGGDEVYIKDCLKKMKRADFYEPHGQKMLVEITEKLS